MALAKIAVAQAATGKMKAKMKNRGVLSKEEKDRLQNDFIERAPDGSLARHAQKKEFPSTKKEIGKVGGKEFILKGGKVKITHRLLPEQVEALDAIAKSLGRSRASLMDLIIREALLRYQ